MVDIQRRSQATCSPNFAMRAFSAVRRCNGERRQDTQHVNYLSPGHAGKATETLASWGVDDIEKVVDELAERGVTFERYDEPGLKTNERGIATFEGNAKVAYFKDPDGHTLSIAQAPRS